LNFYPQKAYLELRNPWRPPKMSELPSWKDAKRVAIDTETCDPFLKTLGPSVRRGGFIAGISFKIEDHPDGGFYLPIAHQGGDNMDPSTVWAYMKDQAREFTGEIAGMNLPYDLDYLAEAGCVFKRARRFLDIGVAAPLINELHQSYSMQNIAKRLGIKGKREDHLRLAANLWGLDPKAEMWRLPARYVADYAIGDVELPLQVLRLQEREFEKQDLWKIWDLECEVLPITVKMRRRGFRINFDKLDQIETWSLGKQKEYLARVKHATGVLITPDDVWKAEAIQDALSEIGITLPRTSQDKPATGADILKALPHDVGKWLVRARKFDKIRTTFAASVREHAVNGRIHPTHRQIRGQQDGKDKDDGVGFGRMSCVMLNVQQWPSPDKDKETASEWRKIVIPEEGGLWACNDYSGQEPRLAVHYAQLAECEGGMEMAERWRQDPDMDLHGAMAKVIKASGLLPWDCKKCGGAGCPKCNGCGANRGGTKAIFLGLCYGMGGGKLCRGLGLPTVEKSFEKDGNEIFYEGAGEEGQQVLDGFDETVPFVRQLARKTQKAGGRRGYIRTIGGRVCRFPLKTRRAGRNTYDWLHKSLNRLIQGSAGDQTKRAMVMAEAAGHKIQFPVHDELDLTVSGPGQAEEVAEIMRNAIPLLVPSKVDVEIGPSWGECE